MGGACPAGFDDYIPKIHPRLTAPMMPETASVYNFTFNKDKAEWQTWSATQAPAAIAPGSDFSDIIVPTQDSARYTFLLDTALRHAQPILFVGPTGQHLQTFLAWHQGKVLCNISIEQTHSAAPSQQYPSPFAVQLYRMVQCDARTCGP